MLFVNTALKLYFMYQYFFLFIYWYVEGYLSSVIWYVWYVYHHPKRVKQPNEHKRNKTQKKHPNNSKII